MKLIESIDSMLSPKGLLVRGVVLAIVFVICHSLGLREFTGFLCGTLEAAEAGRRELFALLGVVYVILYMLATVVAPILVLASGFAFVFGYFSRPPQQNGMTAEDVSC